MNNSDEQNKYFKINLLAFRPDITLNMNYSKCWMHQLPEVVEQLDTCCDLSITRVMDKQKKVQCDPAWYADPGHHERNHCLQ